MLVIAAVTSWIALSPGVEWRSGDGLQVVRVSPPAKVDVSSGPPRTGAEWRKHAKGVAATNGAPLVCAKRRASNPELRSVLVLRPGSPGLPPFTIVDLDLSGAEATISMYGCAMQGVRLIRAPGESVWRAKPKKWAESALAIDRQGRLLLVYSAVPVTMPAFIDALLKSDLDVVRAMHLEGGPGASMSLVSGKLQLDLHAADTPVALPNALVVYGM